MPEPGTAPAAPVVLKADRTMLKLMGLTALVLGAGVGVLAAFDSNVLIVVCGGVFVVAGAYVVWRGFFSGDPLVLSTDGLAPDGKAPIPWEQIEGLFLYRQATGYGNSGLSLGIKLDLSGSWWDANKTPLLQMASASSGYGYTVPLTPIAGHRGASLIQVISENSPVALVDTTK